VQSRRRLLDGMDTEPETYNPWSIVNLVFHHLASLGLHPVLGETGDPGAPAAELLRALGITPAAEGNRQVSTRTRDELAELRAAFEVSQVETAAGADPRCDPGHDDFRR
jgi:hypothetical protein